ncbi:penicillin-binding transpeptidase domain-containing protein [Roseibium salinum]|nr:penicillin-binding transpeptidase domain-containing protein [Roseibium salinum]
MTVRTTLDPALQRQAALAVETVLRENGKLRDANEAALVSMIPDGAVVAMVGGRSYGESQFNRAVNALRQPGSSFKPFVYMTAFLNGYTPESIVPDRPVWIGNWSPKNYTRSYRGPVSLKLALTKSINTIPVRLSLDFGREKIIETAYAMGISHELENSLSAHRIIGSDRDRHGIGLFLIGQRRVQGRPLRHLGSCQQCRYGALPPGKGWAGAKTGAARRQGPPDQRYPSQCGRGRHGAAGPDRRGCRRRQDRHDQRLQGRLVRRLHRQLHHRRLVRQ